MEKQYKRTHKMYAAWNYSKEIEELNRASDQGWQLIKAGAFSSKFKWEPHSHYRYQIDYPGKVEDMGRYLEMFREQGWEFVNSTGNGWYYFRKPYDPALPQEAYEIFTDRQSLQEMKSRWIKLAAAISFICGVMAVLRLVECCRTPTLPGIIQTGILTFLLGVLVLGIFAMKKTGKSRSRGSVLLAIVLAVVILGNGCILVLMNARTYFSGEFSAREAEPISVRMEEALDWGSIQVKYGDFYYMDLNVEGACPISIALVNESGQTVYTVRTDMMEEENIRLKLDAGTYSVLFYDFAGGPLQVNMNLD